MSKKIIILAAAIMLLPVMAGYCQVEEPEIVWEQYVGLEIRTAMFSPDGQYIIHMANTDLQIRDAETGELIDSIQNLNGNQIGWYDFFPDSRTIAITSFNIDKGPIVYIVDIESGDILDSIFYDTGAELQDLCRAGSIDISSDGRYIAFAVSLSIGVPDSLDINQIVIWDNPEKKVIKVFSDSSVDAMSVIGFSNDLNYFVAMIPNSTDNKYLKVLSVPGWQVVNSFSQPDYANDISISPDSKMLATASSSGYIRIWDIESGDLIFKESNDFNQPIYAVNFSLNSRYILSSRGNIKIREINSKILKSTYNNYWFTTGTSCISPMNNYLLVQKDYNYSLYLLEEKWDFNSISEDEFIEQTILYPNPANNKVNIECNVKEYSNIDINVVDIKGALIDKIFSGYIHSGYHLYYWDTTIYPSGTYYCRIETDNNVKTYKIIVNK